MRSDHTRKGFDPQSGPLNGLFLAHAIQSLLLQLCSLGKEQVWLVCDLPYIVWLWENRLNQPVPQRGQKASYSKSLSDLTLRERQIILNRSVIRSLCVTCKVSLLVRASTSTNVVPSLR